MARNVLVAIALAACGSAGTPVSNTSHDPPPATCHEPAAPPKAGSGGGDIPDPNDRCPDLSPPCLGRGDDDGCPDVEGVRVVPAPVHQLDEIARESKQLVPKARIVITGPRAGAEAIAQELRARCVPAERLRVVAANGPDVVISTDGCR